MIAFDPNKIFIKRIQSKKKVKCKILTEHFISAITEEMKVKHFYITFLLSSYYCKEASNVTIYCIFS